MIHGVLAFFSFGPPEMLIILALAVLLFGKRLPEVARSIGKSLGDFQRGVQSIQQELHASLQEEAEAGSNASTQTRPARPNLEDQEENPAPKFEPPPLTPAPEEVSPKSASP